MDTNHGEVDALVGGMADCSIVMVGRVGAHDIAAKTDLPSSLLTEL